jgi:F-type H+-transporting ATPase subunit alpha
MPVEEKVVSIFAGVNGYLDRMPVEQIQEFERSLLTELRERHPDILESIRTTRELAKDTEQKLREVVESLLKGFG